MIHTLREFNTEFGKLHNKQSDGASDANLEERRYFQLLAYGDNDYRNRKCYSQVEIPKKSGGKRVLQIPERKLKYLQRYLLTILEIGEVSTCAAAYVKGKTLVDHAKQHVDNNIVVKLDIENFFDCVQFHQVFRAIDKALEQSPLIGSHMKSYGDGEPAGKYFNNELSWYFSQFCTLNGKLPQGAPTSPLLSNMIFLSIDHTINDYCTKRNITYTRYSDDMIFSGNMRPGDIISLVKDVLKKNAFCLNERKIVVAGKGKQQKVTGIVVNEKPQVDMRYRRQIRKEIHYIGKFGIEEHLSRITIDRAVNRALEVQYLRELLGRINFVLHVDNANKEFRQYKAECTYLLERQPLF